jgi:hypothetical protein
MRIDNSAACFFIGRIGDYQCKPALSKNNRCILEVSADNPDTGFQIVQLYTSVCHLNHILLNLYSTYLCIRHSACQQDRNNPGAGTQICHLVALFYACKMGQQYGICPKAKLLCILDDPQPFELKVINPLKFSQLNLHQSQHLTEI